MGRFGRLRRREPGAQKPHPGWGLFHPPPTFIVAAGAPERKVSFATIL
jgi:hypothetical protein